ncbi:MAG: ArsR family transcriptional regulator [Acidobacteria bacterium]|nr:ArsR family transcriptional regulator [Acidobacteriota bacterium]
MAVPTAGSFDGNEERHAAVERISVEEARLKVQADEAFLVCAYNDKRCVGLLLEGALTRREFEERLPSLSKEQEIIIYCS